MLMWLFQEESAAAYQVLSKERACCNFQQCIPVYTFRRHCQRVAGAPVSASMPVHRSHGQLLGCMQLPMEQAACQQPPWPACSSPHAQLPQLHCLHAPRAGCPHGKTDREIRHMEGRQTDTWTGPCRDRTLQPPRPELANPLFFEGITLRLMWSPPPPGG